MALTALLTPGVAAAADLPATPATFASVFSGAGGGDRILLASGDYDTFSGGSKPATVTIMPQSGAAASIELSFNGASNLRLQGLTIRSLTFTGATHDVTVAGSTFTGPAVIRADQMSNANIVLDGNTHAGIDVCGNCFEGRVQVVGDSAAPSGVTIMNSTLGPGGNADGMQIGANGVHILNNVFTGIRQTGPVHTDALQLYGSSNSVIQGNYFHDIDTAIMAPDGGSNEVISDNVFIGSGDYRPAIQLGGHHGTLFAHNVTKNIDVFVDAKSGEPPGTDNVVRDNVIVSGTVESPASKCSNCTVTSNLYSDRGGAEGTGAVVATPVFAAGPNPTDWAGHVLADSSPGRIGSDNTNRGIRLSAGPQTSAPPAAAAPQAPAAKPEGLVAAYGFNEAKGAWAADSSGAGHRAKLKRVRHTKVAKAGMALSFRVGASLTLSRAASKGLRRAVTLEAWVRPSARTVARRARLGGVRAPSLRTRRWSHLALVYDGHRLRTYVNGRLASSRRAKPPVGTRAIVIGGGFRGQLDDLRVYRRPLAAAEIRGDLKRPA